MSFRFRSTPSATQPTTRRMSPYPLAIMVLFWTIFDSSMQYLAPLIMAHRHLSDVALGAIIGSSSIFGAAFDFFMSKYVRNISYRRVFLAMFAICLIYPLIISRATTISMFLLAMAVWGVYYDLYGFGVFDFISRYAPRDRFAGSFGITQVFRSLGGVIAPLIMGLVAVVAVDWRAYTISWVFLIMACLFFVVVLITGRRWPARPVMSDHRLTRPLITELKLWRQLGSRMLAPLILTFIYFTIEAFFWTLGPLYATGSRLGALGGLLLTAYTVPTLIMGWLVGRISRRMGKKRTAFIGLLIGSIILSFFALVSSPIDLIVLIFGASLAISIALPAINGAYADYITEAPIIQGEIEALEDFSFNLGYVIGPFMGGVLAALLGLAWSFSLLGIIGTVTAVFLLVTSPHTITMPTFDRQRKSSPNRAVIGR